MRSLKGFGANLVLKASSHDSAASSAYEGMAGPKTRIALGTVNVYSWNSPAFQLAQSPRQGQRSRQV
jgi:hypothetical protein